MFLGLDCSTQSLKIQVIDEFHCIQKEVVINYDEHLPHYRTTNGIVRYSSHGFEHIATPTLLFIEALELALGKLKQEIDLSQVKSISGSGQQHGSVWWTYGSIALLKCLNSNKIIEQSLVDFFKDSFSLKLSPIWMDASTYIECKELEEIFGRKRLASVTGSHAYERFTGLQIMHIHKHSSEIYHKTERISLVSSFLASLLIGDYAQIDLSDGSGMNLLDIHTYQWNTELLNLVAPQLGDKLGNPIASNEKIGNIASYWCKKYGFSQSCEVIAFSGDNPCSLVGLGLSQAGDIGISLGTSDVVFAVTDNPKPNENEGSILIHPESKNKYMMMLVYKNGATTRKFIRDLINSKDNDWILFNKSIEKTSPGRNGNLSFYFIESEITPNCLNTGVVKFDQNGSQITSSIDESDCRGIIESQVLSFKHHSRKLGLEKISSIIVTGGGSVNKAILQIIADIFEIDVYRSNIVNTAATGAAIRSMRIKSSVKTHSSEVVRPNQENYAIYRKLFESFAFLEDKAIDILSKKY